MALGQDQQPPPTPDPPPAGDEEFPMPLSRFSATLRGTADEVWAKWLQVAHGNENHTMTEWRALLDGHRDTPAY